jgi:hypothetical protein
MVAITYTDSTSPTRSRRLWNFAMAAAFHEQHPLHILAYEGRLRDLQSAYAKATQMPGFDINTPHTHDNLNVLHAAVIGARADVGEVIAFLIKKGADRKAKDAYGNTPLALAKQLAGNVNGQAALEAMRATNPLRPGNLRRAAGIRWNQAMTALGL